MEPCVIPIIVAGIFVVVFGHMKLSSVLGQVSGLGTRKSGTRFANAPLPTASTVQNTGNAFVDAFGYTYIADLRQSLERIAGENNGTATGFPVPEVEMKVGGQDCEISFHGTAEMGLSDPLNAITWKSNFFTRITISVPPEIKRRAELYPQTSDMNQKFLNIYDIQIGAADFDPRYVIKSDDPPFIRNLLDEETRALIDVMRSLARNEEIHISLNRERLSITVGGIFNDYRTNNILVDESKNLLDKIILLSKSSLLKIVEVGSGGGICPVCGEDLGATFVLCRNCGTPHHISCWDFNKKCAIFGCGCVVARNK